MNNTITQARTTTNKDSVVKIQRKVWYVKTYTTNDGGWTKFHYGDEPPTQSGVTPVYLCGNTKLIEQYRQNSFIGFRVSGGNIQVKINDKTIYLNRKDVKKVWLSEKNEMRILTTEQPRNFDKMAKVVVEIEERTFDNNIKEQVFANLKFSNSNVTITLNTPRNSRFSIISNGTYKILSPDFSHSSHYENGQNRGILAGQYVNKYPSMKNYDVWFPIEYIDPITKKQDRYIHPGQISHGCVTIYDMNKWNDLYDYLISHRDPTNDKYIGILEVRL